MLRGNWFILIFLVLSSCSRVKIWDDLWCVDAGKFGAECFKTLSNEEKTLDKYQWDKLRVGQVCTGTDEPGAGFIHLKTAVEKFCASTNLCSLQEKKAIQSFNQRAEKAISKVKK